MPESITQKPTGSAADLQRGCGLPEFDGPPLQLGFEEPDLVGCAGKEFLLRLVTATESDVIIGVVQRALIPIGSHGFDSNLLLHNSFYGPAKTSRIGC